MGRASSWPFRRVVLDRGQDSCLGVMNAMEMISINPSAVVEVDAERRYISANDSACELLGYTKEELLSLKIDDLAAPSCAHVSAMFENYLERGSMRGIFALKRKDGTPVIIRFESEVREGRFLATWTHYRLAPEGMAATM